MALEQESSNPPITLCPMSKRPFFILLAYVFAFFVALFLAEMYFRHFGGEQLPAPETVRGRVLQYNPTPFARNVFPARVQEVIGWNGKRWRVNSHGYRGADFDFDKEEGSVRLAFFGGSAVFDIYASEPANDWPHQVIVKLQALGRSELEAVNAGIPGHASFDSLGRLFSEGGKLQSDFVFLYNAWNDIKQFHTDESLLRSISPSGLKRDPRLYERNSLDRFFCNHSQLYLRVRKNYYDRKFNVGIEGLAPKGEPVAHPNPEAIAQYRRTLVSFVDVTRSLGATPVLMTQAHLLVRDLSEAGREKIHYDYVLLTPEGLQEAFEACDRMTRDVAKEKDVLLIDASELMSGHEEYFMDHVHLSEAGSEALAAITAEHVDRFLSEER